MLRKLIFVIVFATGVFIGGLFPGFVTQYEQRLDAQFDQVAVDLQPFREIADRYHGGSLAALIEYHLASDDPTFHDEGHAIRQMVLSKARLAESRAALKSSLYKQALFLYLDGDAEVAKMTWDSFTPVFVTTRDALVFALVIGVTFSILCYVVFAIVSSLFKRSPA
jgi:hypothetical protein